MGHVLHFVKGFYSFAGFTFIVNLIGMTLVSLIEGIAILLLIPMLSFSGVLSLEPGAASISKYFGFLSNFPVTLGLPLILGIYILLVISQGYLQRSLTIRDAVIQQGYFRHLRLETYKSLLRSNWEFFSRKRKSDLTHLMITELARVNSGINLFIQLLTSIVFTLIQIIIALWLSAKMTIFVLVCGIFLALFSRRYIKRSKVLGNQTSESTSIYLSGITDQFNGIKDIKGNSIEEPRISWFSSLTQRILVEQVEMMKVRSASRLIYKVSSTTLIVLFIFLAIEMFHNQPEELLVIIVIFSRLWPRFTTIQSNLEQIAANIPAFKVLIDLHKECEDSKEIKGPTDGYQDIRPNRLEKGFECKELDFRYNKAESVYALQNINLFIPANKMTAIVGRSGSGKSTLIDILMGLIQPEHGKVLVDGVPLSNQNLLSLRRSISFVPQDPFLYNASIRENLQMIEASANEEEMWEALTFSSAAEFVKRLPDGLDTKIGDRGVRLSGGERQRLVLARAILRKPSILVLDEATSALDSENETKIQQALDQLKGKMTIIVIAHRLSTIRNADQVIVLDQGKIVQTGQFNQLASEQRGVFIHLLGNQAKVM
ncbi:ABC transporter ATP-binding protein [Ammoniphilus sp. YIM 78166]|uniref:ABC transporter ATP-binding protein n=1 Tax=Ammoniphilus sp. YIM 78166 TaxID=1644106 RepID=UPI00106F4D99|nr:ABC transporter ATP-binding protein [Ammoniphilus sp. YIM 78166]